MNIKLVCHSCKAEFMIEPESYCPNCGGILTVEYDVEYLKRAFSEKTSADSLWKYRKMLPPVLDENIVTFGEGNTPLKRSRSIGLKLDIENLYFKDESKNVTGSFKDRSITECVSMAKQFNCPGIVAASSGNGAASASAYGVKGKLDTILFVPEETPIEKVAQAIAYGGKVIKVTGDFSHCYQAAIEMSKEKKYLNVTTTFLSPYGIEGYKTIAFEIFDDLSFVPDYIFIPVGAGPILYGIWKGFDELKRAGRTNKMPRLVCAQAAGCSPIAEAWKKGEQVRAVEKPTTIASAICDPLKGYEKDGDVTLYTLRQSRGYAYALQDEEMIEAGKDLARQEGLFVEVSSAASLSALYRMKNENLINKRDVCVCILTGHGLKDAKAYVQNDCNVPVIKSISELNG